MGPGPIGRGMVAALICGSCVAWPAAGGATECSSPQGAAGGSGGFTPALQPAAMNSSIRDLEPPLSFLSGGLSVGMASGQSGPDIQGAIRVWSRSPLGLELALRAAQPGSGPPADLTLREGAGRIHWATSRGGVWLGYWGTLGRRALTIPSTRAGEIGGWTGVGRLAVSLAVDQVTREAQVQRVVNAPGSDGSSADSMSAGALETITENQRMAGTTTRLTCTWDGGYWRAQASGAVATGEGLGLRRRVGGELGLRLARPLWLEMGATQGAPITVDYRPAGVSLALRLQLDGPRRRQARPPQPRGPSWRVSSAHAGVTRIEVVWAGARTLELMADFTNWEVVRLEPTDGDRWRVDVPVAPGVHRVAMRVDGGGWAAPPGLPVAADAFAGSVGILTVE
jgi:hypothetical protein